MSITGLVKEFELPVKWMIDFWNQLLHIEITSSTLMKEHFQV